MRTAAEHYLSLMVKDPLLNVDFQDEDGDTAMAICAEQNDLVSVGAYISEVHVRVDQLIHCTTEMHKAATGSGGSSQH